MLPITFITWHPAMATICPSIRWWAVALLDVWTFVGNSLYIIYETSYYRCDWLTVVRPPTNDEAPRVLAYVHNRLTWLRPSLRRDLIDHRDILILSLFSEGRTIKRSLLSPTVFT